MSADWQESKSTDPRTSALISEACRQIEVHTVRTARSPKTSIQHECAPFFDTHLLTLMAEGNAISQTKCIHCFHDCGGIDSRHTSFDVLAVLMLVAHACITTRDGDLRSTNVTQTPLKQQQVDGRRTFLSVLPSSRLRLHMQPHHKRSGPVQRNRHGHILRHLDKNRRT